MAKDADPEAANRHPAAEGLVVNPAWQFVLQPCTAVSPNLGSALKEMLALGGKRGVALINSERPTWQD